MHPPTDLKSSRNSRNDAIFSHRKISICTRDRHPAISLTERAGEPVRCVPPFLFHSEREPNVPFSQQPRKWERTYLESKRVKVALAAAESGIFSGVKVQRMILHRYRHKRQEKRKKVSRRTVHMAFYSTTMSFIPASKTLSMVNSAYVTGSRLLHRGQSLAIFSTWPLHAPSASSRTCSDTGRAHISLLQSGVASLKSYTMHDLHPHSHRMASVAMQYLLMLCFTHLWR